jgi:hypothetical protein
MIKKIIDGIPKDKKDHALLGMFIGYPLQIIGQLLDMAFSVDFLFVLGSIIAISLVGAKEALHDWYLGKGNPEWWDFIASAVPILATLIAYFV